MFESFGLKITKKRDFGVHILKAFQPIQTNENASKWHF